MKDRRSATTNSLSELRQCLRPRKRGQWCVRRAPWKTSALLQLEPLEDRFLPSLAAPYLLKDINPAQEAPIRGISQRSAALPSLSPAMASTSGLLG